ncbi:MAG: hypothetical protein AAGD38_23440, partial [Acidobacteriota bacterium]
EAQTYMGCYECKQQLDIPFLVLQYCSFVGHEEHGSTYCTVFTPNPLSSHCHLYGTPCFNVDAGGGGGSGGSGGSTSCTIPNGTLCPAMCFSCETILY